MNNEKNLKLYKKFKNAHIEEGGKMPLKAALTQLIEACIRKKDYKIYQGGGYEQGTRIPINKYDVVCYLSMAGDPYFMMCMDNDNGDSCTLIRCKPNCKYEKMEI